MLRAGRRSAAATASAGELLQLAAEDGEFAFIGTALPFGFFEHGEHLLHVEQGFLKGLGDLAHLGNRFPHGHRIVARVVGRWRRGRGTLFPRPLLRTLAVLAVVTFMALMAVIALRMPRRRWLCC